MWKLQFWLGGNIKKFRRNKPKLGLQLYISLYIYTYPMLIARCYHFTPKGHLAYFQCVWFTCITLYILCYLQGLTVSHLSLWYKLQRHVVDNTCMQNKCRYMSLVKKHVLVKCLYSFWISPFLKKKTSPVTHSLSWKTHGKNLNYEFTLDYFT